MKVDMHATQASGRASDGHLHNLNIMTTLWVAWRSINVTRYALEWASEPGGRAALK